MNAEQAQQIANTTLAQLGGSRRLSSMIGAKNFLSHELGELSFRFSGSRLWNYVKISLAPSDTYTVQFCKIGRDYSVKFGAEHAGVYADGLRALFERETSLYLSL